jgi:hypothetical protein
VKEVLFWKVMKDGEKEMKQTNKIREHLERSRMRRKMESRKRLQTRAGSVSEALVSVHFRQSDLNCQ